MPAPTQDDPQPLLEHVAWVRALARRLARDAHVGDDVSQQALVAALEQPSAGGEPGRRWLATVARNFFRQRLRADSRRDRHEERAARCEALPSTLELVARAAAQQAVVAAVLRLEEPYRTAVLLRFFEGLPPRVIARRQGVPVATVRTRLARALERLRAELARARGGERGAWLSAIAPLLAAPKSPWAVSIGAAVVNAKIASVVGFVAVGAALWWLWPRQEPATRELAVSTAADTPKPPAAGAPAVAAADVASKRESVARSAEPPAPPASPAASRAGAAPAGAKSLRGRVIDVASSPVRDVEVVFRSDTPAERDLPTSPRARTDDDGRFEMPGPIYWGELDVASPRWLTVLAGRVETAGAPAEPVLVVASRVTLAGFVADESGAAVEGASIALAPPKDFRSSFRVILDFSINRTWSASTDARGRFEIADAPAIPGASLRATRAGFASSAAPSPQASTFDLSFVLKREAPAAGSLAGKVIDAGGLPVAGARVSAGREVATSGDDGRFQLAMHGAGAATVRAAKVGYLPAAESVSSGAALPASLVLRLGDAPLSIRGQVVDADGKPVPAAIVALVNATWFGSADGIPGVLETIVAGHGTSPRVDADGEGRFRLEGLLPQDYRLRAIDPRTLRAVETDDVRAGRDDVRIAIPAGGLIERLAGVVVDRRGEPIPDVTVRAIRNAFLVRMPGGGFYRTSANLPGVKTDAQGHFEIRNVARDGLIVSASAPTIAYAGLYPPIPERADALTIVASRRCHLKVELADSKDRANRFAVLDASGEPIEITIFAGGSDLGDTTCALSAGRSEVVAVEETARTLVLLAGREELRRVALELKPGEVTVVRP